MRDRLIELMQKQFAELYKDGDWNFGEMIVGVADYLLKNGVIVLPVKVGDTIWFYDDLMWGLLPCKVDRPYHCVCGEDGGCAFSANFTNDDIGKTVFLSKEEAEKHLESGGSNV